MVTADREDSSLRISGAARLQEILMTIIKQMTHTKSSLFYTDCFFEAL